MANFIQLLIDYPLEVLSVGLLVFGVQRLICQNEMSKYKKEIETLSLRMEEMNAAFSSEKKEDITHKKEGRISGILQKDDLKIVEGIGPKIEILCHQRGIFTFTELSNTPIEELKKMLSDAGPRYQMHDPTTWPDQAALAREGRWDELKQWQDKLYKGKVEMN
jgi:predicted flap endonuclease-1-like 5' DNA nuclease